MDLLPTTLPTVPLSELVVLPSITHKFTLDDADAQALNRRLAAQDHVFVLCVPSKQPEQWNRLPDVGCVAQVLDVDTSIRDHCVFHVKGIVRAKIVDLLHDGVHGLCVDSVIRIADPTPSSKDTDAWSAKMRALYDGYIQAMQAIGVAPSVFAPMDALAASPGAVMDLAHLLLCMTDASFDDKARVLGLIDHNAILTAIHDIVSTQLRELSDSAQQQQHIQDFLDKHRREFYVRQQTMMPSMSMNGTNGSHSSVVNTMDAMNVQESPPPRNLFTMRGHQEEEDDDLSDLRRQLNRAELPTRIQTLIKRDMQRLARIPASAPESILLRTYMEWVADLPWNAFTDNVPENVDLTHIQRQLDADHYGIAHVKRRIMEYMAILKFKRDHHQLDTPILCFVGPPGVGKTTLAKSIASALTREFHRISLGGVRDEAEIRGHRRTYVGALPGLLIQGLRKCKVKNPVLLLDEIDKLVTGTHQGDPAAALLEVLDPSQNKDFTDHFMGVPFDLSHIFFVATANSVETIPPALLDRMEVIELSGYTLDEKLAIAKDYLWPRQLRQHGLDHVQKGRHDHLDAPYTEDARLQVTEAALVQLIEGYTMESGVRTLDRSLASLCRFKCHEYAVMESPMAMDAPQIIATSADLEAILGPPLFRTEQLQGSACGIVSGLAFASSGSGSVLAIEANCMPGRGELKLTGLLGEVIQESSHIAVSWIKANAVALQLTREPREPLLEHMDVHVHLPNGATPKDGPSAGVAIAVCLVSLLSGLALPRSVAMTGEITLRGHVRAVGGIKEKLLAAHRAGATKLLLPADNERDVNQHVPKSIQDQFTIIYCHHLWDALAAVWPTQYKNNHNHQDASSYLLRSRL
ncbi:Lon protease C-terminal proteolytic domain-containing protein [Gongronella butleri]|nr:Lon protease C-terminal proteolytic domain-containing protein [Gongronella butleri]